MNILAGFTGGLLVGGGIVSIFGVGVSLYVGSALTTIGALGGTGAQIFSIGAISYNVAAMFFAPFFDWEVDPIEYESAPAPCWYDPNMIYQGQRRGN